MIGSDDKRLRLGQHTLQEMVAATQLADELLRTVDRRVDIAAQPLLGVSERGYNLPERHITDHEQINIARGSQLPSCCRTVKEGYPDRFSQRSQCVAQDLSGASGLEEQLLQLDEDRRFPVRL
jgi:hypothetical protein